MIRNENENFGRAVDLIKNANNILLIPHAKMDCDAMSSTIALFMILRKMGKNPTAVCADPVPEAFRFLPSTDIFLDHIEQKNSDFIVTLDISQKGFKGLKYKIEEGKVNILLSSENGIFDAEDFSFETTQKDPDLIIALDTGDLHQIGKIYDDNSEMFSRVPFLNIDHHVSNTNFGTVNLVEVKNSSTTETIYDLLKYLSENRNEYLDEDITTLLLAGMITDTGSFQHANTTPKSLDIAAELIEQGARQQEIIKHLFKTKELSTLRLWGRILTKVQSDPIYRIVWSSVNKNDFSETESNSDETEGLIDELLATTPGSEVVLLIKEREDNIIATSIRTSSNLVNGIELAEKFGGGGHRQAAGFKIRDRGGKSFDEVLGDIIRGTKEFQAARLGIAPPVSDITQITSVSDEFQNREIKNPLDNQKTSFYEEEKEQANFQNNESPVYVGEHSPDEKQEELTTTEEDQEKSFLSQNQEQEDETWQDSESSENLQDSQFSGNFQDLQVGYEDQSFPKTSPQNTEEDSYLEDKEEVHNEANKEERIQEVFSQENQINQREEEEGINSFADLIASKRSETEENNSFEPNLYQKEETPLNNEEVPVPIESPQEIQEKSEFEKFLEASKQREEKSEEAFIPTMQDAINSNNSFPQNNEEKIEEKDKNVFDYIFGGNQGNK